MAQSDELRDELRKYLESALEGLPAELIGAADEVAVQWPIAAHTQSDGSVTIQHAFLGLRCATGRILDISGSGVTGDNGRAEFSLGPLLCLRGGQVPGTTSRLSYEHPINVIATARSNRPVHLTAEAVLATVNGLPDVAITVFAWNPNGGLDEGARFYWRCMVPVVQQSDV
jgi:hypothetical protein